MEQWEFLQALPTNPSTTTAAIHLIRDTFSNVKMQTTVKALEFEQTGGSPRSPEEGDDGC